MKYLHKQMKDSHSFYWEPSCFNRFLLDQISKSLVLRQIHSILAIPIICLPLLYKNLPFSHELGQMNFCLRRVGKPVVPDSSLEKQTTFRTSFSEIKSHLRLSPPPPN